MKLIQKPGKTGERIRNWVHKHQGASFIMALALSTSAALAIDRIQVAYGCGEQKETVPISEPISNCGYVAGYVARQMEVISPKNESVAKLKRIIDSTDNHKSASRLVVEVANERSDIYSKVMIELASVLANMGMSGDDISKIMICVEDPCEKRNFKVKRGPTPAESAKLDRLFKTEINAMFGAMWHSHTQYAYSFRYEKDTNTIALSFGYAQGSPNEQ